MRVEPHANLTITLLRNHIYGVKRLKCTGAPVECRCLRPIVHPRCVHPSHRRELDCGHPHRCEPLFWPRDVWPWSVWPWCGTILDVVA